MVIFQNKLASESTFLILISSSIESGSFYRQDKDYFDAFENEGTNSFYELHF
jgi:hypothetical protein